jgi:hypothetical protein
MPETGVDVTVQPSLPDLELPEYRGRKPVGMKTSVNGAGNRISRPHGIEDRVIMVLEAKVKRAGHEATDDGLVYAEVLKVVDLFEIAGDAGRRLLSSVRQAYRVADDQREGRQPIPELVPGEEGWTDESGVVLAPEEVAELRGDPAAALDDERLTPVVVLFSDGARQLWPEEFDAGDARPKAGDRFEGEEEGSYVYVAKILHAETGETLEEWTDDQEEARLRRLEDHLANEERIADDLAGAGAETVTPSGEDVPTASGGEPGPEEPAGSPPPDHDADVVAFTGPTAEDYAFVDRNAPVILDALPTITDRERLQRLLKAEENGRGRGLKPRKSVVEAIGRRLDVLFGAHPSVGTDADLEPF